ncbi:monocarboxylate transporter 5-like [Ornithodoros turicata]|uniref:monocarboxylate transporter 5-like n=1 Tax=Ornithodoros turicata TaxID=34597 RepID=UPI00313886CB
MAVVRPVSPRQTEKKARKGEGPDSARAWYLEFFCSTYVLFGWAGIASTPVLYVGLIREFGIPREDASAPFTAMMCAYFLGSMVYAILSKWLREKALLLLGATISSASLMVGYFITDVNLLIFVFGPIHGFGAAVVGVVPGSLISQYFVKYRATAMGMMSVTLSLTGIVYPPLTAFLISHFGFSTTLLMLGAISLNQFVCCIPLSGAPWKNEVSPDRSDVSTTPCSNLVKTPSSDVVLQNGFDKFYPSTNLSCSSPQLSHEEFGKGVHYCAAENYHNAQLTLKAPEKKRSVLSQVRPFVRAFFIHTCLSNICSTFIIFTLSLILVDFAHDNGITRYGAAMLVIIMGVGWTVASLTIGPVVDRGYLMKETVISVSFFLPAVSLVLMVLLKTSYAWLLVSSFLIGWGHGTRAFLLFVVVSERFRASLLPLGFAIMSTSCFVPFLCRTPLIGYVRDELGCYDGLFLALAVLAIAMTVSWSTVTLNKWKRRRDKLVITAPFRD